ncbi:MAG: hypothetical protein ACYTKD_09040 [Planctomycetota bacterium]
MRRFAAAGRPFIPRRVRARGRGRAALGLAATVAALVALSVKTAAAYTPLPWDTPEDRPSPLVLDRRPARAHVPRGSRRLFATAGVSFDWMVRAGGDLGRDLDEGRGVSVEIPATLPGWAVYALLDPSAIFQTLSDEAWRSGFRGEGLRTSPVVDELGFVFVYSRSTHDDILTGDEATFSRYGLGVRLGGPGPADRSLRATVSAGWAWDQIEFESRPDREATGPYLGAGLELRTRPGAMGNTVVGLRLDARWDWPRGLDGVGGRFSGQTFTAGAGVVLLW